MMNRQQENGNWTHESSHKIIAVWNILKTLFQDEKKNQIPAELLHRQTRIGAAKREESRRMGE